MLQKTSYQNFIFFLTALFFISQPIQAQNIVINEYMASNALTIADEDGDFSDWIELYNAGPLPVNLSGYGLSDDASQLFRWVFPNKTMQVGEYLLIWASGKNKVNPLQPLHTNFSISAEGEEVLITKPANEIIDRVGPIAHQADISYGRLQNQTSLWRFFSPSSPGIINALSGFSLLLTTPVSTHASGYYSTAFDAALSTTIQGSKIVFTTDGSDPKPTSPEYTSPINIRNRANDPNVISLIPTNNITATGPPYYEGWQPPLGTINKITVLRSRLYHPDAPPGPIKTFTYFVNPILNSRYSLPVFSLATTNANLFDYNIGIYVHGKSTNYFQDGDDWERPANVSLFEKNGLLAFSHDIGIRTHGNTSRSRPRKSLRVISRSEYGTSWINYQLFPDKSTSMYKRFIFRNSGNDWDMSIFRDAMLQTISKNLKVERQYYRPIILFINGEYWGIHDLRDRYDEHYFFAKYGINEMDLTILENNSLFKFGNPAGTAHYNTMRSFSSTNNLAIQSNYDALSNMMDIESFTDFQIANIFAMNTDWPGNNSLYWRYYRNEYDPNALGGRDGRWRWMLLDMDFGFGLNFTYVPGVGQGASHNTLSFALVANGPAWPNPPWSTFLLRNLIKNETFKIQFINRFCDLLNSDYSEATVVAAIDSIKNMLQPEMQEHINRWRRPTSLNEWQNNVTVMRNFAQQRPAYVRQHINNQFNLQGTAQILINNASPQMGNIQINSIVIPPMIYWSGLYFKNIPVKLQALPKPGFRFVNWSGASAATSETITLPLASNTSITAHFEPSNDFQGDSLNPRAYRLANGSYLFSYWDENNASRKFPPHMIFQQSSKNDPMLADPMTHPYNIPAGEYHADDAASIGFPYRLTRRTRLNGLGNNGLSFINTGRNRDLGAVVLAIDTRGLQDITVSWKGGTIAPASRTYNIRLQYRTSIDSVFKDVKGPTGELMEYVRNSQINHEQLFPVTILPADANNKPYVQLRWKYYFTGIQLVASDGTRDMLRLDDIAVSTRTMDVGENQAKNIEATISNFPNPFSRQTTIVVEMKKPGLAKVAVFSIFGNKIADIVNDFMPAGTYTYSFDAAALPAGTYLCVLETNKTRQVSKMLIMR